MHQCIPPPPSGLLGDPQGFADAIYGAIYESVEIWPSPEQATLRAALDAARAGTDLHGLPTFGSVDAAAGDLATAASNRGVALGIAVEAFRQSLIRLDLQS